MAKKSKLTVIQPADAVDAAVCDLQDEFKVFKSTPTGSLMVIPQEGAKPMPKKDRLELIESFARERMEKYIARVTESPMDATRYAMVEGLPARFKRDHIYDEIIERGYRISKGTVTRDCCHLVSRGVLVRIFTGCWALNIPEDLSQKVTAVIRAAEAKKKKFERDAENLYRALAQKSKPDSSGGYYSCSRTVSVAVTYTDLRRLLSLAFPNQAPLPPDFEEFEKRDADLAYKPAAQKQLT